jgi:hypothetical protein
MTEALASAWADIRANNPKVPQAVIGLAPDPGGSSCTSVAWESSPVVLAVVPSDAKARDVLGWLLHQAAHGIAARGGIGLSGDIPAEMSIPEAAKLLNVSNATAYRWWRSGPVSREQLEAKAAERKAERARPVKARQGRYHGPAYRDAATSLGLEVSQVPDLGWKDTRLPDAIAKTYEPAVRRIAAALKDWEPPVPPGRDSRIRGHNGVVALCSCPEPRRIRITESVLELGPVVCGVCGELFEVQAAEPVLSS